MQSTRQHILDHLEQHGSASARQLAQAFGMTAANLRRHLRILQSRGLVAVFSHQAAVGRGRPQQRFVLSAAAQGPNFEPLVKALLQALPADSDALKQLAQQLLGDHPAPTGQSTRRLLTVVKRLTPLGYKPRWEAKPQGPEVVLGRCPYANIIAAHPELCQMDAHMLESLLGTQVEQTAKLQPGPQGLPLCIFISTSPRLFEPHV